MKQITGIIVLAALITSCATTGGKMQAKKITPGSSAVYVFRVPSSLGASAVQDVYIDGRKLAELRNASYTRTALPPGKHTIRIRDHDSLNKNENKHYSFTLKPGQKHYVQVMWTPSGKQKRVNARGFVDWLPHYGAKLVKANPSVAKQRIKRLHLAPQGV